MSAQGVRVVRSQGVCGCPLSIAQRCRCTCRERGGTTAVRRTGRNIPGAPSSLSSHCLLPPQLAPRHRPPGLPPPAGKSAARPVATSGPFSLPANPLPPQRLLHRVFATHKRSCRQARRRVAQEAEAPLPLLFAAPNHTHSTPAVAARVALHRERASGLDRGGSAVRLGFVRLAQVQAAPPKLRPLTAASISFSRPSAHFLRPPPAVRRRRNFLPPPGHENSAGA
ncbi:uncharacterized protein Tco025E_08301 [Trypanosoma conorhini]|uniref:Uncharacterized protein n=1 Tax=Trypanosoma conorhini TaxID=83891 RepID=A0A3R7MBT1_9TRYP|nr:uncharacterized protein Tco025E_08301 [Trypanosoma conorhini]RNF02969.1 hypothetical protein Tco025E_08301 [Trypanosoma conorhini]